MLRKFEDKKIKLDVVDINPDSIEIAKLLLSKYNVGKNVTINFIVDDFLLHSFNKHYDYAIGNPPFCKNKIDPKLLKEYKKNVINDETNNLCSFFLEKAIKIADYVALVFPKFLLNTPEFAKSRSFLSNKAIERIIDFGEKGFPGVLVETLAIYINNLTEPDLTNVISITKQIDIIQRQEYICDSKLPYWIIYRNHEFDKMYEKLDFDQFSVFRDRQLTNSNTNLVSGVRVLKSRNIDDSGTKIIDIPNYDAFVSDEEVENYSVSEFLNMENVYLTPNMTYKPRVMRKPKGVLVNGSVAILIPKSNKKITDKQLAFFSSSEYRNFYQIARNYQTRSLNVDACSVYFYGLLK